MKYVHQVVVCQNLASTAGTHHWVATLTFTRSAAARAAADARLAAAMAARAFSSTSDEPRLVQGISATGG